MSGACAQPPRCGVSKIAPIFGTLSIDIIFQITVTLIVLMGCPIVSKASDEGFSLPLS